MSAHPTSDGAGLPRRFRFGRRTLMHTLGLLLAALLAWLIAWGYRQPAFLIELSNMMMLC